MAKKPLPKKPRSAGVIVMESFFGTFPRAMSTIAILFVIYAMVFPDRALASLNNAISVVVSAIAPAAPHLIAIAIALWAIRFIVKKAAGD